MKYRNILKKRILAGLLAGVAACAAAPALAASGVVPNTQLPQGGNFVAGGGAIGAPSNGQMTITQNTQNGVIKWDGGFNIGANATVNFEGPQNGYNTLNYDASGNMSQIYGAINANNNGNIYIVNPAGVEISNSAQINVGSLYVSNRNLDNVIDGLNPEKDTNPDISKIMGSGVTTDAALMSLGNINASSVTFDGSRVVIDTERLKTGDGKMTKGNIIVHTTDKNSVVIGYDAYEETFNGTVDANTYEGKDKNASALATVYDADGNRVTDLNAYMWVEDVEQLQKIDTNLGGNYALRNSIDATATQEWNNGAGFKPIGIDSTGKVIVENSKYGFHGNFDGLSYNIFNLNINRADAVNVGLFGVLHEAEINNVTFVGGAIKGGNVVGSLAGAVLGNTHVNNVMNSASVTGGADVGGIIGYSGDEIDQVEDSDKPITVDSADAHFSNMVNTGTVVSSGTSDGNGGTISDAGGLIGNLYQGTLDGTSYNLGSVTGEGHNVGGLVGHAYASKLGDGTNLIYNRLDVTGAYNVGGIVGNMVGTTVQNAENSGIIAATGYDSNGKYSYHTAHYTGSDVVNGVKTENVNIANAGGIAGSASNVDGQESKIENAVNTGDVSSAVKSENGYDYYEAGNVGGIVGSAVDTNITNATNRENEIRGAHNVGGIAGYFSGKGTVEKGTNDGGDIMATGARNDSSFVKELVRPGSTGDEEAIIGNMGGIVGYMDGDNVFITGSANRGTVHSQDITGTTVLPVSQAANAGGIVGKIDRSETLKRGDGQSWEAALTSEGSSTKYDKAAVSNSYSTGDVRGYMGVGGIAGMMYNGEIAGSYNLGTVNTTRNAASFGPGRSYYSVNMGGIVGDTTEETNASALLYDVYNKGQIGDETFTYYARHVGGIVGRLSGTVEKAYNTGAIYNGYNVVGGIVGWMYTGSITNAFNTGNITVNNQENGTAGIQAGGIAGGARVGVTISNVYNLGTIRGFQDHGAKADHYAVGGIVGAFIGSGNQIISNAYTTGNLYLNVGGNSSTAGLGSIYGLSENYNPNVTSTNTYYIQPDTELKGTFTNLYDENNPDNDLDNSNHAIAFGDKDKADSYKYEENGKNYSLSFTQQQGGDVDGGNESATAGDNNWRIYAGSTPILNAFLPNAENYFSTTDGAMNGIASIQYGTAYDPLLTIVNAAQGTTNLEFNWQDLKINNDAGLAVYDAGLTLNDFMSTGGSGYFGGVIYSDGALTLNAHLEGITHDEANTNVTGDVALGSASQLYGSSVAINADGQVTIYGSVTATGNKTTEGDDPDKSGSISIIGGNVDIYGQLTSAKKDGDVFVPGINGMAADWKPGDVNDPKVAMSDIGDRFGYTTSKSKVTGNISITANDAEDGHVNVHYGNKGEGIVTTGGDLTVTASGDIYMDSDLSIGGNLTLNAGYKEGEDKPAADSEAVLDISNIGKVQAANDAPESKKTSVDYLHEFMHHFAKNAQQDGGIISFTGGESKIAVDMWDEEINEGKGGFNLDKFDIGNDKFVEDLNHLNFTVAGDTDANAQKYTYIWVSTGEQLKGIQQYKKNNSNSNILSYNFALKNDIDASDVTDYEAIGAGAENGYTGTFDGRDNRIIGLDTTKRTDGKTLTNAGIFDTIGAGGTVEDLRVYSGTFTGKDNAGAVAGVNKGNISNVTAFGNVVTAQGSTASTELGNLTEEGSVHVGAAGGIAGVNYGTIDNASAVGTATAADAEDGSDALSTAGGIAGINMYDENINKDGGIISNSTSNSAVNASAESTYALGGVAGVNAGKLDNVDSLGVTTGLYKLEGHNSTKENQYSDNVGGIVGTNSGTVTNAYNESIVSGRDNVGGILGVNTATAAEGEDSPVSNVANASRVTGEANSNAAEGEDKTSDYVGGLVGDNEGSITNGRNNGEITGNNYVGGLVGANGKDSTLTNLVNDESAAIIGDNYVGGIAGTNEGTISAENQDNLINRGTITGQKYVGGVAGENIGTIEYIKNDIDLIVRDPLQEAMYFGGVAGVNGRVNQDGSVIKDKDGNVLYKGTITSATNQANIVAPKADYVGGIVGWNTAAGDLEGMGNSNEGRVEGASHVGGVAGKNDADIAGTVASMIGIENSGVVIAHNGGAGGIFGENTGKIEYVEMTNKGVVSGTYSEKVGTNGTGGIIGVNSGDVSHSSLKNETGGQVMGTQNVGGLIGVNSGDITGGRTEEDGKDVGYYKYQIYNNGTIKAGMWTWNDENNDGKIDHGETSFEAATKGSGSQNIAGLIGINQKKEDGTGGTITAGYNTGVINADNSTNVGGIAGTNEGTLDQVFNTVITADGQNQTITGGTNVGGIAGTNSGTISDAYNTTAVTGTTDVGSIAGTNSNTADDSISNVYSTITGSLVGGTNTTVTNGYNTTTEGNWMKAESYDGFDFNGSKDNAAVWKIYEGSTNPLLKVFLTKLTVDGNTDLELVYNGQDQDIDIGNLLENHITGPTGFADAYNNTKDNNGNSVLLENTNFEHKNAGEYDNWLYSGQIAASNGEDGFNPNNLGYDIDFKQDIDKAVIKVQGNTVDRTYGSSNISDNGSYGFIVRGVNTGELTSEMKQELTGGNLGFDSTQVSDGALSTETGRVTNDVSDNYTWSANLSLGDALKGNYVFEAGEGQDGTTTTVTGQSHVNKANLTINAGGDTIYVGGTPQFSGTANAFVNGDSFQLDFGMSADNANLPQTAGTYDGVVGFWYNGTFYGTQAAVDGATDLFGGNYKVTFRPGTLTVLDLPEGMPDISDIPSIERHWNFLFDDNPWDRNRDFRERKAEVHYIGGGMTL